MFFDGASRVKPSGDLAAGVAIVLVSRHHHVIPRAFTLTKPCSNNVAEYNALLIGMKITHGLGIRNLETYGDSQLIVCQVQGLYAVRKPDLMPYHEATMRLAQKFKNFYVEHLPRRQNVLADTLASLATSLALPPGATEKIWIYTHDLFCPDPPYEGIPLLPSVIPRNKNPAQIFLLLLYTRISTRIYSYVSIYEDTIFVHAFRDPKRF